MRKVNHNMSVTVDMKAETVKVIVDGKEATTIEFIREDTQIMVASVDTEPPFQHYGYGRLAFGALKLISEQRKLPIVVWSLYTAIPFYERIGLLHLNDPEVQKRVIFGNIETAELHTKIDSYDFVYIPQSLNRRKPVIFT